jgi:molecular chaperone DnaJ
MKSPWDVLEIEPGSSPEEAKKAFKKLALKYHPDRNPGDAAAEEKFKEINAAHEAIASGKVNQQTSDPGFNMDEINDFFAGGFRQQQVHRSTIHATLTFKEYCLGASRTFSVQIPSKCAPCQGVGAKPGDFDICAACNGAGSRTQRHGGMVVSLGSCPACRGKGKTIKTPCSSCDGRGEVFSSETISVNIPPMPQPSMLLNVQNRLHVQLTLDVSKPDADFRLYGTNVHSSIEISLADALFGVNVDVETIHGTKKMKVPPMDKGYIELRLKGQGAGRPTGDHIIECTVIFPESDDDRLKIKNLLSGETNS